MKLHRIGAISKKAMDRDVATQSKSRLPLEISVSPGPIGSVKAGTMEGFLPVANPLTAWHKNCSDSNNLFHNPPLCRRF
jgi:predicted pyridoxine 5'-phosphate oxidase superfamily flavin-nucleotide-binding protein